MSRGTNLSHGFAVGLLRDPAGSREVSELIELDRLVRRDDALLRSGPAVELTPDERETLNDQCVSMGFVAVDLASCRYIGYTSAHRAVTRCRGAQFEVQDVVVHPEFERRGVGRALMVVALQEAQQSWGARKATLTSRPSRVAARGLYTSLGFEQLGEDRFELKFGGGLWFPPEAARPRLWSGTDREDGGSFWRMAREMQDAVSLICADALSSTPSWTIVEPTGVYKYKDAP